MARIVFVHGINNQDNSRQRIERDWMHWIVANWKGDGEVPGFDSVDAAFYGDILHEQTQSWGKAKKETVTMSGGDVVPVEADVVDLYRAYQHGLGISDAQVAEFREDKTIPMGDGVHKGWLKAITRAMETILPTKGKYLVRAALPQAAAYLHKPMLKDRIDEHVRQQVFSATGDSADVIVSHSLGTVVTYRLLRDLRDAFSAKLFITLGSPLGIDIVQFQVPTPRIHPSNVARWVNAADREDFVALQPILDRRTFGAEGIVNYPDVQNSDADKHSIEDYLGHEEVRGEIASALTA